MNAWCPMIVVAGLALCSISFTAHAADGTGPPRRSVEERPFGPPAPKPQKAAPKDTLALSGIMTMDNKKVALINNEIYEVGETVQGMKIVDIAPDSVQIKMGGKVKTLKIRKK